MSDTTLRNPELLLTSSVVAATLFGRHRLRITDNLERALDPDGGFDWFLWSGQTPDDDEGRFWIPALFPSARLPLALRELREARRQQGRPSDDASCRRSMATYHSGLGMRFVAKCAFAFVEIDHLPRGDQEARYDALTVATGLRWCLRVFTGGKSVHAYLAFTVPLDPDDPLRLEIQRLLVVILEGDTRITDAGRLMRRPGWNGPRRKQPVVHLDADAHFDALDIRDRLRAYAVSLGITDVDLAFRTLELAEALGVAAKHYTEAGDTEAAVEIREHAAVLRATRADPPDDDVRLARSMLGKGVPTVAGGATPGSRSRVASSSTSGTEYRSEAEMAVYEGLARLTSVRPPCCADNAKLKGTVLSEPRSPWGPVVWCHKHHTRFVVGFGRGDDADVPDTDIDALLANYVAIHTEGSLEDEAEDEVSDLSEADARILDVERARWRPYAAEMLASEARLATILDDVEGPYDGSTSVPEDFVYRRLLDSTKSLQRTNSEEAELPRSEPDLEFEARVTEALDRWVNRRDEGSRCGRGPYNHTCKVAHEAGEAHLPCCSYRCTACGPWKRAALRASAWVVVRRRTTVGAWKGLRVVVPARDGTVLKALGRWVEDDRKARFFVGFALNPNEVGLLVVWNASVAAPAPSGGLGRHLTRLGAVEVVGPVHEAVDALADGIELGSWADAKRAEIVRGRAELVSEVSTLHKRVLGRSGAKGKTAATGFSVRTYTTGDELRREVEALARAPIVVGEVESGGRSHASKRTWSIDNAVTPVLPFLENLRDEGFFRPLRRRAGHDGSGFVELSLAAK